MVTTLTSETCFTNGCITKWKISLRTEIVVSHPNLQDHNLHLQSVRSWRPLMIQLLHLFEFLQHLSMSM